MAIVVKINERKEPINELVGTLLAWGLVAGLIAKIFGIKFNFSDTDDMRSWGFQLGDAIKFSRQKIKNSSLNPQQQAQANDIINNADLNMRRTVQRNNEAIEKNPTVAKTLHTNEQVMAILNKAVLDIRNLLGGDKQKAEEIVEPLRQTADVLTGKLNTINSKAALAQLSQDPGLINAIKKASDGRISDENVQVVMAKIAERVKS